MDGRQNCHDHMICLRLGGVLMAAASVAGTVGALADNSLQITVKQRDDDHVAMLEAAIWGTRTALQRRPASMLSCVDVRTARLC